MFFTLLHFLKLALNSLSLLFSLKLALTFFTLLHFLKLALMLFFPVNFSLKLASTCLAKPEWHIV